MNHGSCTGDELPSVCSTSVAVMNCVPHLAEWLLQKLLPCISTTENGLIFSSVGRGLECRAGEGQVVWRNQFLDEKKSGVCWC